MMWSEIEFFIKELAEQEADFGLKERVKRNSSILNQIERQEVEDLQNQRWLEQKFTSSLTRSGSLGSNRSHKSVQSSSKDSDDSNFKKPTAPAKPPRSGRSSSTGSKDSKDSKRIVVTQRESSENVFEEETENGETENPYTIIATPAEATEPPPAVEPVVDELPKIQLRDVVLDKTMKLDRTNDEIFKSTTSIIKELTKLKNSCDSNGAFFTI